VSDLVQEFVLGGQGKFSGRVVQAVSGVSLELGQGEVLAIVGETGSGKSTLARAIMQTPRPKSGSVVFKGIELGELDRSELRRVRRQIQMIFQDPFSSLNPKLKVRQLIADPIVARKELSRDARGLRVEEVLQLVELEPAVYADRRPGQLSGGQCQRVAIARALAVSPELLICDEPVSALDVMVQAGILNLFESLRATLGLSYLFISHDLAVVRRVSDRVAVMYLGRLCEVAPADQIFEHPRHHYTAALMSAIPKLARNAGSDGKERLALRLDGDPPSALDPPSGCRFRTRCPAARDRCAAEVPELREISPAQWVACHFPAGVPTEQ
jgi:oligopeptide transport system ATP-binding protein